MARWDRIISRGNVEDRRGLSPMAVGGVGLGGIALILAFNLLTGGDAGEVINQLQNIAAQDQTNVQSTQFEGEDEYEVFASTVLGSNNSYWQEVLGQKGVEYQEPTLVLFRAATESGCGAAYSQVGPHYCPPDKTIYLDETFFDELTNLLGAIGGDVAEAYVIGHEVGHHVQSQLGILEQIGSNEDQVAVELQADCFAGLWANSIKDRGVFEEGEIKEAMDAAAAVGDDRIQKTTTGMVNPETWTHGSSEARLNSFKKGYETGDFNVCN